MATIVAEARKALFERGGDYRRPRLVSYACRVPMHMHTHIDRDARRRSGTAMRDLVPLRRSTFELGLPRSQLCPYGQPRMHRCIAHLLSPRPCAALLPSFLRFSFKKKNKQKESPIPRISISSLEIPPTRDNEETELRNALISSDNDTPGYR